MKKVMIAGIKYIILIVASLMFGTFLSTTLGVPPAAAAENETIIYCPETVTIDNIKTLPVNIPNFTGQVVGNVPAIFTFSYNGMNTPTDCFCQYSIGELVTVLKANMNGYTSCNVAPNKSILLYK
jgi:hypothetical protein